MIKKIINIIIQNLYVLSLYTRQIAGTVILFLIARYLPVYEFGLFSSYKNIAVWLFALADLNYHDYTLVSSKAKPKIVKFKVILFIMNAIFLGLIFILFSQIFPLESYYLFVLVIVRTFFDVIFLGLILPLYQTTNNFKKIAQRNILYSILLIIITAISYFYRLSLANFLILNIIIGFINFLQCSNDYKLKYISILCKLKKYVKLIDKKILGYIGCSITFNISTPIPILFVSFFIPKEEAALFFAALTIASIPNLIIIAQTQKLVPQLVKSSKEKREILLKKNIIYILALTFLCFIGTVLIGKFLLLLLYGHQEYVNAYYILLLLMLGNIFWGITNIYMSYVTAIGYQGKSIIILIKLLFLSLLLLFVFCKFGIYGAAVTYLLTRIYMLVKYRLFCSEIIKN